jgi:hypothetical protein
MDGKQARQHMAHIQIIILHGCRRIGVEARQGGHPPPVLEGEISKN